MTNALRPALAIAGLGVLVLVPSAARAQSASDRAFEVGPTETAGALGGSGL